MKIFETIRNYFAIVGITSQQSIQSHPFNRRNSLCLFVFGMGISLTFAYQFRRIESFQEFTDCFYEISTISVCGIGFASFIWEMVELFEFIDRLDDFVNKSKLEILSILNVV